MPLNLSLPEMTELKPRISVIGVGGAGGNAVNNMIESSLEGVDFIVANTDAQALRLTKAEKRIQLGATRTQGLGAGSLPEVGREAAEESLDEILEHVGNSHMLFITAGMGGGTGTGAAPVIARAAKEKGILAVGVVTKPFHFEGARRMKIATAGIQALQEHVDTLIIIPNQNLFSIANERTTFHEAFALADQVLHSGVRGITDLMVMPGLINLDFNDVRTVMSEMGKAMMGTGEATGDKRALEAAEAAISNPLLDEVSMKGARGVLINITGSMDMTLFEVDEAANRIRAEVDPDANIIVGSTFNQELEGRVRVSVVATGIEAVTKDKTRPGEYRPSQPTSRPWRETAPEVAPTAASPAAAPAFVRPSQPLPPAEPRIVRPAAVTPAPTPIASPNPVGDVHERIKRLLTEGDGAFASSSATSAPADRGAPREDAARMPRNPFREAQTLGKTSIGAAVDMFKSMGSTPARKEAPPARAPEAAQPGPIVREDLFDDEDDAELEIPSFLRQKNVV